MPHIQYLDSYDDKLVQMIADTIGSDPDRRDYEELAKKFRSLLNQDKGNDLSAADSSQDEAMNTSPPDPTPKGSTINEILDQIPEIDVYFELRKDLEAQLNTYINDKIRTELTNLIAFTSAADHQNINHYLQVRLAQLREKEK